MVDVGHAIDHTGIVLPEYGGNAFSRKFLQESLTGGLSLQGGSDSFLRLYGYGMSGNSLFAFHKFLLECLVAYAFTDLAGFDGYAGPFSFFIGSRIDQSMIGLSLYRLVASSTVTWKRPSRRFVGKRKFFILIGILII